jgi:RNA polymerase sigma factor (sigma-70 family)
MPMKSANGVLSGPLRALWSVGVVNGLADGELIERMCTADREAAGLYFQLLLERHGPMVLRICRFALHDPNDADDALQATFLVLLRHARRIRNRGSVASWLHGVAMRVAARAKVDASRRRRIEQGGRRSTVEPEFDWERRDLELLVHHEVARLPEKYRAPTVLCYLEGLTHERAADQLGWPVGTVRGRLARARDLLRTRLSGRGISAAIGLAGEDSLTRSATAAVPVALRDATLEAALRLGSGQAFSAVTSAQVANWADDASRAVTFYHWNVAAGAVLLIAAIGSCLGLALAATSPPQSQPAVDKVVPPPAARKDHTVRLREMLEFKGTWTSPQVVTDGTVNGVPQAHNPSKWMWSVDRDIIREAGAGGFDVFTYRFTIDPSQTPKTIDLLSLNTGIEEMHGIYKLEADTLTVCTAFERPRPKDFVESRTQNLFVLQRQTRTPALVTPEIANAPGCYWIEEPKRISLRQSVNGLVTYRVDKDPQGAMTVTLTCIAKLSDGEPYALYRPVAVDNQKKRYTFEHRSGPGSTTPALGGIGLAIHDFRLDPEQLPFDSVQRLGVEIVPAEIRRAAEAADN